MGARRDGRQVALAGSHRTAPATAIRRGRESQRGTKDTMRPMRGSNRSGLSMFTRCGSPAPRRGGVDTQATGCRCMHRAFNERAMLACSPESISGHSVEHHRSTPTGHMRLAQTTRPSTLRPLARRSPVLLRQKSTRHPQGRFVLHSISAFPTSPFAQGHDKNQRKGKSHKKP